MSRPSPRSWPYLIAVLLLPLLVLWRQGDALYTPAWYSDPWFYTSGFRDLLEFKRGVFYSSYYSSRLSWLLPGWAVYSLFPPIVANAVLHLGVHLAATAAFFSVLRRAAGARAAFLATLVFSVHPWLWAATGWDYVDGPGIAYCLIAMAALARASEAQRPRWPLVLAGAAIAGAVYSNIFWIALAPVVVLTYFAFVTARPFFVRLLRVAIWTGAGFLAVTLALCIVNYLLDGFFWFYSPSIAVAFKLGQKYEGYLGVWDRGVLAPWLWPSIAGTATSALLALWLGISGGQERRGPAMFFSAQLLFVAAFMTFMQWRGSPVLGYSAYASYLLPFAFLAMGCAYWPAAERMRAPLYGLLCASSALVFAWLWGSHLVRRMGPGATPAWRYQAAITTLLAIGLLLRNRAVGPVIAMAGFAILTAASMQHKFMDSGLYSTREEYARIMHVRDRVNAVRKGRVARFWYNEKDPNNNEYAGVNSLQGAGFRKLGVAFPAGCEAGVYPNSLVVALSVDERAAEVARNALADCWRPMGMTPTLEFTERIAPAAHPYTIAILRAQPDPSRWIHLEVTLHGKDPAVLTPAPAPSPLPVAAWSPDLLLNNHPEWTVTPAGVRVRTPRGEFVHTARFATLEAPFDGRYWVRMLMRDRMGQIAFGSRDGDDQKWLAADVFGRPMGASREMSVWLPLRRGERFVIRISNNDLGGRGRSSFLLEQTTIDAVPAGAL
jgi:hypothetical protein